LPKDDFEIQTLEMGNLPKGDFENYLQNGDMVKVT
jgi:hypothetical protein